jgi:cell division protein FtsB
MKAFFLKYLNNKFFYTGLVFLVWLTFFDQENLLVQNNLRNTLDDLKDQKEFYLEETEKNQQTIESLETDSTQLEKLAREKYYMKRENEDVYVFVNEKEE